MYNKQFRLANATPHGKTYQGNVSEFWTGGGGGGGICATCFGVFLVEFVKCKCASLGPVIRNQEVKFYICVGDLL